MALDILMNSLTSLHIHLYRSCSDCIYCLVRAKINSIFQSHTHFKWWQRLPPFKHFIWWPMWRVQTILMTLFATVMLVVKKWRKNCWRKQTFWRSLRWRTSSHWIWNLFSVQMLHHCDQKSSFFGQNSTLIHFPHISRQNWPYNNS
jgi:hypothetical protein